MTDERTSSRPTGGSRPRRPRKKGGAKKKAGPSQPRSRKKKAGATRPRKPKKKGSRRPARKKSARRRDGRSEGKRPASARPEAVPPDLPETAFGAFDIAPRLVSAIAAAGYVEPTPIQKRMIPLVLEEKNVVGRAQTGTGKTAAFLVPLIALLDEAEDEDLIRAGHARGPVRILVVVPVRELAIQVAEEAEKLTRFLPIRTLCVYGGTPLDRQARLLEDSAIVVGTPGRLLDHIRRGNADLSRLDAIVLDEVDRMYDLGFRDDVDRILAACPKREQTLLTSATLNEDVERLIEKHVGDHERVLIETRSLTVEKIDQTFYFVDGRRKQDLLMAVVEKLEPSKGLIFLRTRFSVDRVTYRLQQKGYAAELLHSGIPQRKRELILQAFRDGSFPLLVATDVASRGLDIEDVTHVINFDVPQNPEDYVHRVGRTARMGKSGAAVTFVTIDDGPYLTDIEKLINKEIRQETFPGFEIQKPADTAEEKPGTDPKRPPGLPPWANVARRKR